MKKRFYLVRHGEKVKTAGDPPLSDKGNKQAQQVAKHLKTFPITRVVASPILRTQQTAKHIADSLSLDFELSDLLRERVNWGDDPSQSFEDFLAMWTKASADREWIPPVGDSSYTSGKRLETLIQKLLHENDEHIVLVTHGGVTTDFLRNNFSADELRTFIPNFEKTLDDNIKECSVTIIEGDSDHPELRLIDLACTDHLE